MLKGKDHIAVGTVLFITVLLDRAIGCGGKPALTKFSRCSQKFSIRDHKQNPTGRSNVIEMFSQAKTFDC